MLYLGYLIVLVAGFLTGLLFNRLILKYTNQIPPSLAIITAGVAVLYSYITGVFGKTGQVNIEKIPYILLAAAMVPVIIIDIKQKIIPNEITLPLLILGLLSALIPGKPSFFYALSGTVIGGGILYVIGVFGRIIFKKEGMGGGDIKLMAAAGAFIGPFAIIWVLFLGSLIALVIIVVQAALGKKVLGKEIPFGPYLALGLFSTLFLISKTGLLSYGF
jgi:leader peptidase (prepilin peptidase)/N-methyltransferase